MVLSNLSDDICDGARSSDAAREGNAILPSVSPTAAVEMLGTPGGVRSPSPNVSSASTAPSVDVAGPSSSPVISDMSVPPAAADAPAPIDPVPQAASPLPPSVPATLPPTPLPNLDLAVVDTHPTTRRSTPKPSLIQFVDEAVKGTSLEGSERLRQYKDILADELFDADDFADLSRRELSDLGLPKGLCAKLIRHSRRKFGHVSGSSSKKRKRDSSSSSSSSARHDPSKLYTPDKNLANTQQLLSDFASSLNHDPQDFILLSENEVLCKLCDSSLRLHRPLDLYAVKRHILGTKKFQSAGKRTNHMKKFYGRISNVSPGAHHLFSEGAVRLNYCSDPMRRSFRDGMGAAGVADFNINATMSEVESERLALNAAHGVYHCWCLESCPIREASSQKGRKFVSCMRCHYFSWVPDDPRIGIDPYSTQTPHGAPYTSN